MPIYEYECRACGHTLDVLQKVNDKPLIRCPECNRRKLARLVSAPKFRLKGSGWYETDFKSDNKRNLADTGAEKSAAQGNGKGETKSDTAKPDKAPASDTSQAKPKDKGKSDSGDGKAA